MWCVREAFCVDVGENRYVWRHVTAVQLQCVCVENESQLKICHYHHHHDQREKNKRHKSVINPWNHIRVEIYSSVLIDYLTAVNKDKRSVKKSLSAFIYCTTSALLILFSLLSSFYSPYIPSLLFLFSPSLPLSRQSQCCSISNTTE